MQSTRRATRSDSTSSKRTSAPSGARASPSTSATTPPRPPAPRSRLDQIGELRALPLVERVVDARAHAHERLAHLLDAAVVAREHLAEQDLVEVALSKGRRDVGARLTS